MKNSSVLTQIKVLLGMVSLESMKLEDGQTIVEAESFAEGNEVFVVNGEEKVPLPKGEYILEDGKILEVNEQGFIVSVKEKEEAPIEEAPIDEVPSEVEASTDAPLQAPKKIIETVTKETHLSEVKRLEDIIAEKEAKIVELSEVKEIEVIELSEETPALIHNPEGNTKKENLLFKTKHIGGTTKDRVFASLFN